MSSSFWTSFIDDFVPLGGELAPLLLDWRMVGVDLESVYCYVWVNSYHVLVGPSKAIVVLLEELNEYESEFCAEACPNLDFVVRIVGMDTDVVEFIYAWLVRLRMLIWSRL